MMRVHRAAPVGTVRPMLTLLARTTRGDAREALRAAGRAQKAGRAVGTREACMLEGL